MIDILYSTLSRFPPHRFSRHPHISAINCQYRGWRRAHSCPFRKPPGLWGSINILPRNASIDMSVIFEAVQTTSRICNQWPDVKDLNQHRGLFVSHVILLPSSCIQVPITSLNHTVTKLELFLLSSSSLLRLSWLIHRKYQFIENNWHKWLGISSVNSEVTYQSSYTARGGLFLIVDKMACASHFGWCHQFRLALACVEK